MFSIITPTIGRPSLLKTCKTINEQTCDEWEHLVVYDGPKQDLPIFTQIQHPQRKIIFTGQTYNDYGHSVRHYAWDYTTHNNLMYLDDDDYYHPACLATIKPFLIIDAEFFFFPALRINRRFSLELFMHEPPGLSRTVSCQYVHRKHDPQGQPIRFPSGPHGEDGRWIGKMCDQYRRFTVPSNEALVFVPIIGNGTGRILELPT
jgi:glycosyltransferase involved in cell wall biosynthesis